MPWAYEVSKCAFQESLRNLDTAIKNWKESKTGKRKGAMVAFPTRKSRKNGVGSCRFSGTIKVFDGQVQLPRIGLVRLKEYGYIPVGSYGQATISEQAGHWFVSVIAEFSTEKPVLTGDVIGIDVGIKTLATCSDGTTFDNPKALNAKTKRLRRWQRRLSRRQKGSQNRKKAKMQVAKIHKQVADTRRDAHNKTCRSIVNKAPSVIVIEDLNVKGMFKNHKLARALSDASFGQFERILTYMTEDAGIEIVKTGRFFASSKTCACCGWKKEDLKLSERTFVCVDCGHTMDRDLNAAMNLKNTVSSTGIYACGDSVRPGNIQAVVAEARNKQHSLSIYV